MLRLIGYWYVNCKLSPSSSFRWGYYYFLYNIFSVLPCEFLTGQFEGVVTHLLASLRSAFYRTSDIWQSSITINQQKVFDEPRFLDSVRILLPLGIMSDEESTVAHSGHYNIYTFFGKLKFTLSETARARDKVFFDWEIYRAITFETSKIKKVIYKNGAHVFWSAASLFAFCVDSFIKRRPAALYRWVVICIME